MVCFKNVKFMWLTMKNYCISKKKKLYTFVVKCSSRRDVRVSYMVVSRIFWTHFNSLYSSPLGCCIWMGIFLFWRMIIFQCKFFLIFVFSWIFSTNKNHLYGDGQKIPLSFSNECNPWIHSTYYYPYWWVYKGNYVQEW